MTDSFEGRGFIGKDTHQPLINGQMLSDHKWSNVVRYHAGHLLPTWPMPVTAHEGICTSRYDTHTLENVLCNSNHDMYQFEDLPCCFNLCPISTADRPLPPRLLFDSSPKGPTYSPTGNANNPVLSLGTHVRVHKNARRQIYIHHSGNAS